MHGLHLTADLRGCAAGAPLMSDPKALRARCLAAVSAAGLLAVGELFHPFASRSAPRTALPPSAPAGITGVVLLAESHVAVHTWPEIGAVTLDVYVCNLDADNSAKAHALLDGLVAAFAPGAQTRHVLERGVA